ncbi:hypothetical protein MPH_04030 [Macrophomina phaseolina MS6]|uniref:Uncharacterized protein n=1 Tax=Macrophomina phaseolina (strain MS6) TaxID=1126212 RepID=K2S8F1_MACPH|nr:hypothetical protein MPH_04030 [Macrophomina phaseolina MS6]
MARTKIKAPPRPTDDYELSGEVMAYAEKLFPGKSFRLSVGRTGVDFARLVECFPGTLVRDKSGIHIDISYGEPTAIARLHNLLRDTSDYQDGEPRRDPMEVLKELQKLPPLKEEEVAAGPTTFEEENRDQVAAPTAALVKEEEK